MTFVGKKELFPDARGRNTTTVQFLVTCFATRADRRFGSVRFTMVPPPYVISLLNKGNTTISAVCHKGRKENSSKFFLNEKDHEKRVQRKFFSLERLVNNMASEQAVMWGEGMAQRHEQVRFVSLKAERPLPSIM